MAETIKTAEVGSLTVMASNGANENAARLAAGEADVGLIQADTALGPEASIIARTFPEAFHLVVRDDAGIESVNDLRGKRVGVPGLGSGSFGLFKLLLRHYEISPEALTLVEGGLSDHAARIENGDIDAFFMVIALGNPAIERVVEETDTLLLPIEQAEAMALFDPAFEAGTVPVGTYSGERPVPAAPIPVVTVSSLVAVRNDLPPQTVEGLTRALFENRQAMVRLLPQAAFIAAPTEEQRRTFSVHPGADQYYNQDNPHFIVEYAEPLALGVTAFALLMSAAWQGRVWLSGARKNRADHYNLEIIALTARVEEASTDEEFAAIRRELFSIFERAIVDLDNDRIEEKSLLSFSFAWQAAATTLNHRQLLHKVDGVRAAGPVDA